MTDRRRWLAALAALMLAVLAAGTVLGYAGEVAASVTVSRPSGTIKCAVNIPVTATILDATGKRISGQPVAWSIVSGPSSKDKINTTSTLTDANGVARTTVKLACVPGSRVMRATADGVRGQAVLNVTAAGLPRTSTLPAGAPGSSESLLGILLAVLALAVGGGLSVHGIRARGVAAPR